MKQKIKSTLEQGYKNLGVSAEAFERVATLGETLVKSDEDIATFVKGAEAILKAEQSAADKVRTELNAKIKGLEGEKAELEAKLNGNQPNPNPTPNPEPKPADEKPDFKAMFAEALAEVVNPFKEEIATFKAEQSAKTALSTAEATFKGNDYVKKYADEATDAWERATEMYEATGKSWTAEQLQERAMGYFNKAVAKKGVDTSKPFDSDGGGDSGSLDMSDWDKTMESMGWNTPKEN